MPSFISEDVGKTSFRSEAIVRSICLRQFKHKQPHDVFSKNSIVVVLTAAALHWQREISPTLHSNDLLHLLQTSISCLKEFPDMLLDCVFKRVAFQ